MQNVLNVMAYIDWDSATRVVAESRRDNSPRFFSAVFEKLQSGIQQYLESRPGLAHFRVSWRIYHGWYSGRSQTDAYRKLTTYLSSITSTRFGRVVFSTDIGFSDILLCPTWRSPLLDTVRYDDDKTRQKMVDTALVCDLLQVVRFNDFAVNIIVAEDDDFVPAAITAEAWKADVTLLRRRSTANTFLKTAGLIAQWGQNA